MHSSTGSQQSSVTVFSATVFVSYVCTCCAVAVRRKSYNLGLKVIVFLDAVCLFCLKQMW